MRLGCGRQDYQSFFSLPPGLTICNENFANVNLASNKIVVIVDAGESCPHNTIGALLKEQNHNFAERFTDSKWIAK